MANMLATTTETVDNDAHAIAKAWIQLEELGCHPMWGKAEVSGLEGLTRDQVEQLLLHCKTICDLELSVTGDKMTHVEGTGNVRADLIKLSSWHGRWWVLVWTDRWEVMFHD